MKAYTLLTINQRINLKAYHKSEYFGWNPVFNEAEFGPKHYTSSPFPISWDK